MPVLARAAHDRLHRAMNVADALLPCSAALGARQRALKPFVNPETPETLNSSACAPGAAHDRPHRAMNVADALLLCSAAPGARQRARKPFVNPETPETLNPTVHAWRSP